MHDLHVNIVLKPILLLNVEIYIQPYVIYIKPYVIFFFKDNLNLPVGWVILLPREKREIVLSGQGENSK